MELSGKTVIVTGAARGIGRGIAKAFVEAGARVVVADLGSLASGAAGDWSYALSSQDQLEATARELGSQGGECKAVEVDVTDRDSCRQLVEKTLEHFGRIDVLVNNAGVIQAGAFVDYAESDWDRVFAVNVKGIFLLSQATIPSMTENGGAIINIASIAGRQGVARLGAYCASKFAVIGLTQSMADELGSASIRVSAICPGILPTAMWLDHLALQESRSSAVGKEPGRETYEATIKQTIPLGRQQTPQDIGEAAVFLAQADNITGVALNVSGGRGLT